MKWCDMEPAPRVKKSGPESAPRRSPWSNPVISTPTTPTTPPRANPNALRKIKESEPKLKQNENSHIQSFKGEDRGSSEGGDGKKCTT